MMPVVSATRTESPLARLLCPARQARDGYSHGAILVQQASPISKQAGAEPIPGYRLLAPLGQGGFGEVWKCEAPGGLFKAIKFVGTGTRSAGESTTTAGVCPARQEWEALERVKTLRHPFILCLDRVEVVDDTLVVIME